MSKTSSRKVDPELTRKAVHETTDDARATQLNRMREQLAEVQHHINNPLAVVLGNVQFLLLKSGNLDDKLIGRLKVIEKAALKISEVNQRLSDLATLTSENDTAVEGVIAQKDRSKANDS